MPAVHSALMRSRMPPPRTYTHLSVVDRCLIDLILSRGHRGQRREGARGVGGGKGEEREGWERVAREREGARERKRERDRGMHRLYQKGWAKALDF